MSRFWLTGSRYYGQPREDSDFDILVDGTQVPYDWISSKGARYCPRRDSATRKEVPDGIRSYYLELIGRSYNFIWCETKKVLAERLEARELCFRERPVTRTRAVEIHEEVSRRGPENIRFLIISCSCFQCLDLL